jgi:hypothetical protein
LRSRRIGERTEGELPRLFDAAAALDLDTLFRVVDDAEMTVEGRVYDRTFMGSAMLDLDVAQLAIADGESGADLALRLRQALAADPRARRVLADRAFRETARLLGVRTPTALQADVEAAGSGTLVRVDIDLEGRIEAHADAV